jgi:hypothetical protein
LTPGAAPVPLEGVRRAVGDAGLSARGMA